MDKLSKAELLDLVKEKTKEIDDLKTKKKSKKISVAENLKRHNGIRALARGEAVFYQAIDAIEMLKSCLNEDSKDGYGYILDWDKWSKVHPNDLPITKLSFEEWTQELVQVCFDEENVMKFWFNMFRTFRDSANHLERKTKNVKISEGERPDPPEYDLVEFKGLLDELDTTRGNLIEGWEAEIGMISRDHKRRRGREHARRKKRTVPEVVDQVVEEEEEIESPPPKRRKRKPRTRGKK